MDLNTLLDTLTTHLTGTTVVEGPANTLPTQADGRVAQAVIVWVSPGRAIQTRSTGGVSGRADTITLHCVGPTSRDALKVAGDVRAALAGRTLTTKGGPLIDITPDGVMPTVEPGTNPVRVFVPVQFASISKGAVNAIES